MLKVTNQTWFKGLPSAVQQINRGRNDFLMMPNKFCLFFRANFLETSHKWRVVHLVWHAGILFFVFPFRAKVEQKGRVIFLWYPTKSHLTNNITTQTRPPSMLKSNLTNPGSIQLHFSHPTPHHHHHHIAHPCTHAQTHAPTYARSSLPVNQIPNPTALPSYIILLLVAY